MVSKHSSVFTAVNLQWEIYKQSASDCKSYGICNTVWCHYCTAHWSFCWKLWCEEAKPCLYQDGQFHKNKAWLISNGERSATGRPQTVLVTGHLPFGCLFFPTHLSWMREFFPWSYCILTVGRHPRCQNTLFCTNGTDLANNFQKTGCTEVDEEFNFCTTRLPRDGSKFSQFSREFQLIYGWLAMCLWEIPNLAEVVIAKLWAMWWKCWIL